MFKTFQEFANHWRYDLEVNDEGFYSDPITQRVYDAWEASRSATVTPEELKELLYAASGLRHWGNDTGYYQECEETFVKYFEKYMKM